MIARPLQARRGAAARGLGLLVVGVGVGVGVAVVVASAAGAGAPEPFPGRILSQGSDTPAAAPSETARHDRFLYLLRTYPERPIADSFAAAAALIDQGPFPERDRAEYWVGSARLAASDREGARAWFARLERDYPGSVWVERSFLGLGDLASHERRYDVALGYYGRALAAHDAAVRELARISTTQTLVLRTRQRWAWAAAALVALVALALALDWARRRPRLFLPLPSELQIVLPVLLVFSLLSLGIDPAPRRTTLALTSGGALLVCLSGLRQRAAAPRGPALLAHLAATLAALLALAYLVVWQWDLFGMVLETFRTGPE